MEVSSWRIIVSFSFVFICGNICGRSQEIGMTFSLENASRYEVVFVGQTGITLICEVTNAPAANITITNPRGEIVASNGGRGIRFEYVIATVRVSEGGKYTCNAQYLEKILCKSLHVNVQSDEQGCARTGIPGTPFGVGDTLSLTCYCNEVGPNCTWIETVVKSRSGNQLQADRLVFGKVTILRATVGPLMASDLNFRFDCAYGRTIDERCSIGPANVSANDYVLRSAVSCSEITTTSPPAISTTEGTISENGIAVVDGKKKEDEPGEFLIYIIIAGVALFVLCLLVVLIILATGMKRSRKVKTVEEQRSSDLDPNHDSGRMNLGYDASDCAPINKKRITAVDHRGVKDYNDDHHDVGSNDDDEFRGSEIIDDTNPRMSIIVEINQQGALMADRIRSAYQARQDDVTGYGRSVPEMSQYGTVATDQINEADEFVNVDVTEYGVPRAFTSSTYGDDVQLRSSNQRIQRVVLAVDY